MTETRKPRHRFRPTPFLLLLILFLLIYQFFLLRPKWEYRLGTFGDADETSEVLHRELDALGEEGWELVAMEIVSWGTPENDPTEIRAALRRRTR